MVQRGDDHSLVLAAFRRGHRAVDQAYRRFAQHTGRLAAIVAIDHAALRRVRGRVDAGAAHRRAVEGTDVTAGACEDDWSIRIGAIEIGARRHPPLAHRRLVVAAPEQPRARRQRATVRRDARHQLLHAADAPQIEHRRQQLADLPDVRVRVVEARNQAPPAEIDPACAGTGGGEQGVIVADCGDTSSRDADGRRGRRSRLSEHRPVVQHEVQHNRGFQAETTLRSRATASTACASAPRPSSSMSSGK